VEFEQVFIIGCGDVGTRVAQHWRDAGVPVCALTRTAAAARRVADLGLRSEIGDLDDVWSLRRLDLRRCLLYYFAPPPDKGANDVRMRTFVNAVRADHVPVRVVLISTTGVYGDCAGDWVDETRAPDPQTDRARRRLDAENIMRVWGRNRGVPVIVLRVAGIYGPDRLPVARIRSGEPVLREDECGFTNRIHINDLVRVCIAAAERGSADNVYNISDGNPGTMTGYFNAVADALDLPRPPAITCQQADDQLSAGMLSYLRESRRLSNGKMLRELGVQLRYPDLSAGLAKIQRDRAKSRNPSN